MVLQTALPLKAFETKFAADTSGFFGEDVSGHAATALAARARPRTNASGSSSRQNLRWPGRQDREYTAATRVFPVRRDVSSAEEPPWQAPGGAAVRVARHRPPRNPDAPAL